MEKTLDVIAGGLKAIMPNKIADELTNLRKLNQYDKCLPLLTSLRTIRSVIGAASEDDLQKIGEDFVSKIKLSEPLLSKGTYKYLYKLIDALWDAINEIKGPKKHIPGGTIPASKEKVSAFESLVLDAWQKLMKELTIKG